MTEPLTTRAPVTTRDTSLILGTPGRGGYRRIEAGPGEPHLFRGELGSRPSGTLRSLVSFIHLSDLHVADVQSPARAEFLDRFGDEDSSLSRQLGRVGVYRAQEALTVQVVEAMARRVRRVEVGPVTGAPIDFAISTGDATDNCQSNELDAYIALLEGGQLVSTDSGDLTRFEGAGSLDFYDRRYWHPDGTPAGEADDLPRARRGFPLVPGLLDAARLPLLASGIGLPWYTVYGNHDALIGGILAEFEELRSLATGANKHIMLDPSIDPLPLLLGNESAPSPGHWGLLEGPTRAVTADPARRPATKNEWLGAHFGPRAEPIGHGLSVADLSADRAYYAFDAGVVRFLVLDTVNAAGGWQGSLDVEQFAWLEHELLAGSSSMLDPSGNRVGHHGSDRLFVLASHHPLETLINDYAPNGERRVLRDEIAALLARFKNVVCWVNGHTHENAVTAVPSPFAPEVSGFWQVTTASHIDWPQQCRIIEIALDEEGGDIVIVSSMLDHAGTIDPRSTPLSEPESLAGWSRELSANAWQGRVDNVPIGQGRLIDRNVVCSLAAPFEITRT